MVRFSVPICFGSTFGVRPIFVTIASLRGLVCMEIVVGEISLVGIDQPHVKPNRCLDVRCAHLMGWDLICWTWLRLRESRRCSLSRCGLFLFIQNCISLQVLLCTYGCSLDRNTSSMLIVRQTDRMVAAVAALYSTVQVMFAVQVVVLTIRCRQRLYHIVVQ